MLSREDNDLLTQTGPGTPMGEMFRRYWLPVLRSDELPENDCPPVRVQILSERLIAFRDSDGQLGLIDEFCAHRGISLWFGRNEEGGLRCPYHGWKYDVNGNCTEIPSESEESGLCNRIKLTAYPMIEKGGVIWGIWVPKSICRRSRNTSSPACLWSRRIALSASRNVTGYKRWREASTRLMSPSCIGSQ